MRAPVSTQLCVLRLNRQRKGGALVELAIIFPVLLLMCCGAMDFARVVYAGIAVSNAARAGVQYGTFSPGNAGNTGGMQQAALDDAAGQGLTGITASASTFCLCSGNSTAVSCTSSTSCGSTTPNGYAQVTVSYTFNTMLNYPGIPSSIVLNRTAKMRVQ